MIVTEQEALTKRCQESFGSHGAFTDAEPELGREIVTATRNCLGSACMAWRWKGIINVYEAVPEDQKAKVGADFTVRDGIGGYCGKAGLPLQPAKAVEP